MILLFLASAGFVLYAYLLFPLWLHLRARNLPELEAEEPVKWPTVSIVIAAHNEAANLPAKFKSLEELDYPPENIQWVVVSDGSSDDTVAVVEAAFAGHDNRVLLHYDTPKGKCGALNAGVERATGEMILFMDARQPVSSNAARTLIPFLMDPAIGAATGELILSEDSSLEAANFGLYWRYEKWIRDNESKLFSTTGVTGALYAIRRADFVPNPEGTLLDDFDTPVGLLKSGKRTVFVPGADGWLLTTAFWVQVVFYGLAVCSYLDLPIARHKALNLPKVFVQMNAAAFMATLKYFGSSKAISWR